MTATRLCKVSKLPCPLQWAFVHILHSKYWIYACQMLLEYRIAGYFQKGFSFGYFKDGLLFKNKVPLVFENKFPQLNITRLHVTKQRLEQWSIPSSIHSCTCTLMTAEYYCCVHSQWTTWQSRTASPCWVCTAGSRLNQLLCGQLLAIPSITCTFFFPECRTVDYSLSKLVSGKCTNAVS